MTRIARAHKGMSQKGMHSVRAAPSAMKNSKNKMRGED